MQNATNSKTWINLSCKHKLQSSGLQKQDYKIHKCINIYRIFLRLNGLTSQSRWLWWHRNARQCLSTSLPEDSVGRTSRNTPTLNLLQIQWLSIKHTGLKWATGVTLTLIFHPIRCRDQVMSCVKYPKVHFSNVFMHPKFQNKVLWIFTLSSDTLACWNDAHYITNKQRNLKADLFTSSEIGKSVQWTKFFTKL